MPGGLRTDLYELNMATSYLRREMHDAATFSLFVRVMPPNRGFLVSAGLEASVDFLERLSFEEDDLSFLRAQGFEERDLEALRRLRFTGDVWAVPEGRVLFANEPLLEVTAPIAEAQLAETFLLNAITLHTTVASKAARSVVAAAGRDVVDFSFRRDQGIDAALAAARASSIVGSVATSNVEAARTFGLRATGTMAHSFVEAFPTEREAFRAFAEDHPDRATFLVDTYDTLGGVRAAIEIIRELDLKPPLAVRLDSGDLLELSRAARAMLDADDLREVRIFASGGLDEFGIDELVHSGAPIDAFGVGTKVGVSADAPYVDSVYKLVEYASEPVSKLSPGKASAPGAKQIFRRAGGDVLALRWEKTPVGAEPLLEHVMHDGKRLAPAPSLKDAREWFRRDLEALPPDARRIESPSAPIVSVSPPLRELDGRTSEQMRGRQRPRGDPL
jgi:nicotinate phosphoribosyltransferase